MGTIRVCFDRLPMSRWGALFQILLMERDMDLEWEDVGFPKADRPLLEGFDAGILVQRPLGSPSPGRFSPALLAMRL